MELCKNPANIECAESEHLLLTIQCISWRRETESMAASRLVEVLGRAILRES